MQKTRRTIAALIVATGLLMAAVAPAAAGGKGSSTPTPTPTPPTGILACCGW